MCRLKRAQLHQCGDGVALAEVFTMGIKAGVEPIGLWEAARQGRPAGNASSTGSAGFCRTSFAPEPDILVKQAQGKIRRVVRFIYFSLDLP